MLPIEQRCTRVTTRAFVTADTVDALADKMLGIIGDRRAIRLDQYLGDHAGIPELVPGQRVWHCGIGDPVRRTARQSMYVTLGSHIHGVKGVGFSIGHNDDTEDDLIARYNSKQDPRARRDLTVVSLNGCPGEPRPKDNIRVEHWNKDGVGRATTLVFDDILVVEELAWDIKGDRERRVHLWDEYCDTHDMHVEHPEHPQRGCSPRTATLAENLDVLAHLARTTPSSGVGAPSAQI